MVEPTFPDKLDVLVHGGGPLFSISIADLGDKGLLQACRERDPGLSDQVKVVPDEKRAGTEHRM